MKNLLNTLLCICLFSFITQAQTITISPVLGYGHFKVGIQEQVGKFIMNGPLYVEESNHIGLTGRFYFKKDKFYIQPTFTYGNEAAGHGYSIINTDPQQNGYLDENGNFIFWRPEFNSTSHLVLYRVYKSSLAAGASLWKPNRWFGLRGFAGFALDYRTEKNREDNLNFYTDRLNRRPEGIPIVDTDELYVGITEAEKQWILNGYIGLGIDLGKFWLDVSYHRSLTGLSRDVEYYDEIYDYNLNAQQLLFGLGYNIPLRKGEMFKKFPKRKKIKTSLTQTTMISPTQTRISSNPTQTIMISPVVGYGLFKVSTDSQVGKYQMSSPSNASETKHIGLTSKFYFQQDRFYIQPTLTYGEEISTYQILNTNPQSYTYIDTNTGTIRFVEAQEFTNASRSTSNQVFKLSLVSGTTLWKPTQWLGIRGFLGFALDFRYEEGKKDIISNYKNDSQRSFPEGSPLISEDVLFAGIISAENDWIINGQVGLGIDISNFWLDVAYHRDLTGLSRDVEYYNEFYDYKLNSEQLLFTFGYNIPLRKGEMFKKFSKEKK